MVQLQTNWVDDTVLVQSRELVTLKGQVQRAKFFPLPIKGSRQDCDHVIDVSTWQLNDNILAIDKPTDTASFCF